MPTAITLFIHIDGLTEDIPLWSVQSDTGSHALPHNESADSMEIHLTPIELASLMLLKRSGINVESMMARKIHPMKNSEPGPPLEYDEGYDCECHDYPPAGPWEEEEDE